MPPLGDVWALSRCDRLEAMITREPVRRERVSGKKATHDRRPAADVGYKVWNTFEAELRTDAGGRRDEVAKTFKHTLELVKR
jgi:hypothetical protein